MSELGPVILATIGGVFPALAWLWFWLREDSAHPEPRRLIALAFLAGMVTVAVVIPIQQFAASYLSGMTAILIAWAFIEELMKYVAARVTVLRLHSNDEPIDPVIYMVTVALGFAAAENALFLFSPFAGNTFTEALMTGNLRFVGAMLLHVLASAVIGIFIGLSFYKSRWQRWMYLLGGVILAGVLHNLFNFLILNVAEEYLLRTFGCVWVGLIVVIGVLEYVKRVHPAKK